MKDPKGYLAERNRLMAPKVVSELEKRNFEAYYCETKEQAREKAISLIPTGSTIAWGGSESVVEIGLIEALYQHDYNIIDRDKAGSPEEKKELDRQGFSSNYYLMSTNGISEDGQLVNVDGNGNRVASLSYGPDYVVMIVSINKVTKTLEDAISRSRNTASPLNAVRVKATGMPCTINGVCNNCKTPECICNQILITRMCKPKGRIKVILVGEELGF